MCGDCEQRQAGRPEQDGVKLKGNICIGSTIGRIDTKRGSDFLERRSCHTRS